MSTPAVLEDLDWPDEAVEMIIGLSLHQDTVTADDLARVLRKPPHPNMTGPAFQVACAEGHIEQIGFTASTQPLRHGSVIRVWKRVPDNPDRTP